MKKLFGVPMLCQGTLLVLDHVQCSTTLKNILSQMEYWMKRKMLRTRSIAVLKFLGFNIKILATQVSGLIRLPQAEIYVDPKTLSQGLELLILEYSHLSQLLKLYTREGGKPILNLLSQTTFYH